MKLVSWNVNGLRALHKNGRWMDAWRLKPDILGLQEIKAEKEQLPDDVQEVLGYHAFFNPSRARKGYSGVALYSKKEPVDVRYGLGDERFDVEGRLLEAHFDSFVLLNVYFPNGGMGPERLQFKYDYYDAFLEHVEAIKSETGKSIVFCGDINTAHEEIDLARPKENENNTGFLPDERAWIDEVIAHGYIDTYRHMNPDKVAYSYWDLKSRARERNVGWRIDYFFVSRNLLPKVKAVDIHDDIFGSDHCPVSLTLDL